MRILLLIGLLVAPALTSAQPAPANVAAVMEVQSLAHSAFLSDDLDRFLTARSTAQRFLQATPTDFLLLHYLGYIDFRIAALKVQTGGRGDEMRREVAELLRSAQASLERSAQLEPMAETYALLSAVHALRAGTGPPLAIPRNANRAGDAMDRALALGANNPRVRLIRGINFAQTPRIFGGGIDKARTELERALELFPSDPARAPFPTWGYGEAYAWLGIVHVRAGRTELARDAYRRALELEPTSNRVRNVLLPRVEGGSR